MLFHSILFRNTTEALTEIQKTPASFRDLNLDQVIDAVTTDWTGYNIRPFFYSPLTDVNSITYRQEIFQDLEDASFQQSIRRFSVQMQEMRKSLSKATEFSEFQYAAERWFLCAVECYIAGITILSQAFGSSPVKSEGLTALREYLNAYINSANFRELSTETKRCSTALSSIQYCVLLKDGDIAVSRYNDDLDYSSAVDYAFARFRPMDGGGRRTPRHKPPDMNHVQAQVLGRLAQLYPEAFAALSQFHSSHCRDYIDETVARFDREIQFYVSYLTFLDKLRRSGLTFSRPQISQSSKEIRCHNAFDIALAHHLLGQRAKVVPNDFHLIGTERILVVSGPNQGGKTTFARMCGQMHFLARLGCPVPGTDVNLFLTDHIFTHFERREDIRSMRGKLQEDLVCVRHILDRATSQSLIVMNELFSSTTITDASYLSTKIMEQISQLDALCVWVTFLEELASFNTKTVSMVGTVDPENPAVRTYKIERQPANGLAYALALALKHRVTYGCLRERFRG